MSTVEIPLSQGLVAVISESDYDLVAAYKWHAVRARFTAYAANCSHRIYMHRLICNVLDKGRDVFIDHINHDGLNNTRENLRVCTPGENVWHRRAMAGAEKRGVWTRNGRFYAQIKHLGKNLYLGSFESEIDASNAYHAAAVSLRNEFVSEESCLFR